MEIYEFNDSGLSVSGFSGFALGGNQPVHGTLITALQQAELEKARAMQDSPALPPFNIPATGSARRQDTGLMLSHSDSQRSLLVTDCHRSKEGSGLSFT